MNYCLGLVAQVNECTAVSNILDSVGACGVVRRAMIPKISKIPNVGSFGEASNEVSG